MREKRIMTKPIFRQILKDRGYRVDKDFAYLTVPSGVEKYKIVRTSDSYLLEFMEVLL